MIRMMKKFWKDEDGVTAIEYGLIAALIAVAIVAAVGGAGEQLVALWERVETELTGALAP